jgi:hypothetical protein
MRFHRKTADLFLHDIHLGDEPCLDSGHHAEPAPGPVASLPADTDTQLQLFFLPLPEHRCHPLALTLPPTLCQFCRFTRVELSRAKNEMALDHTS